MLGRAVVLEVVLVAAAVVEEATLATRGTAGFFSGTEPAVEEDVAGLAAAVRVRLAAVVETELRVGVVVLGLAESTGGRGECQTESKYPSLLRTMIKQDSFD